MRRNEREPMEAARFVRDREGGGERKRGDRRQVIAACENCLQTPNGKKETERVGNT